MKKLIPFILILLLIGCSKQADLTAAPTPSPAFGLKQSDEMLTEKVEVEAGLKQSNEMLTEKVEVETRAIGTTAPMNVIVDENEGVEDFYSAHNKQISEMYPQGNVVSNWQNRSPQGLMTLGGELFYNAQTHMSVLVYEDKLYFLGEFEGGEGIAEALLFDANGDGRLNLGYTYTYLLDGEVVTQSAYFDFVTLEEVLETAVDG